MKTLNKATISMEIKYATPSECGRLFTDDEWPCLVPKADESDQVMVGDFHISHG